MLARVSLNKESSAKEVARPAPVSKTAEYFSPEEERRFTLPKFSWNLGQSTAPPIVHEVLRSPGQPLDATTRTSMESRFRHDFSDVRIHSDARAAESAESVSATAYTVGPHIVLGHGQPSLASVAGRPLLAHELAHVVQQSRGGLDLPLNAFAPHERDAQSAAHAVATGVPFVNVACHTGVGLARNGKGHRPDAPPDPAAKNEARLAELARYPAEAHHAWRNLKPGEKTIVVDKMAARYGVAFAHKFREVAEHGKPQFDLDYWQPNSGPSPEQLKAKGWRFMEMENTGTAASEVEVWVNPSGGTTRRDVSTYKFGQTQAGPTKEPPEVEPPCPESAFNDDLEKIEKKLWPAMANFEGMVERLASNPAGTDTAPIDADISQARNLARNLITDLSNLKDSADQAGDEECMVDLASEHWGSAMEEYTRILQRYNGLKNSQSAGSNVNP